MHLHHALPREGATVSTVCIECLSVSTLTVPATLFEHDHDGLNEFGFLIKPTHRVMA